MKFGIVTDLHYSTKESACTTRRPNKSLEKLKISLENMKEADLIVCLGDLVDDCGDESENLRCISDLMQVIRSCGKPFYCIPGNHDCTNFNKEYFYSLTGCPKLPYVLSGDTHDVIFIDACFAADGSEYRPGKVNWTDTDLDKVQMESLKSILDSDDKKPLAVMLHQCLDPNVEHRHLLHSAGLLREMLEKSGKVDTVIEGHYHPGADNVINGIHYLTLPAMCELDNIPFTVIDL